MRTMLPRSKTIHTSLIIGKKQLFCYLEGYLCDASRTLDVESEYVQTEIFLIGNGLFARIELFAFINVLATGVATE